MRELLTPHQSIRYRAADFLALWRCNEASGSLNDDTGSYTAAVASGTIGATASLFASPAGTTGARTFSSSRATATGNTSARTALLGEWTIAAWVKPTSITASAQYLVAYAGGNTLASLGLSANTGEPFVLWRRGTTDYTATSNTGTTAGSTFHVAAVKDVDPVNAGRYRVTFYVNGVARGTTSNLLGPDGGTTSPLWNLGTNGAGSLAFGGTLDEVAVLKYAATPQMVRDLYARGASSVDAATTYAAPSYEVQARVTVYTAAGVAVDVSSVYGWDLLRSISLEDDVDSQGATCSLEVVREVYELNVAPLMATSAPNVDAGGELFALNRRLLVETATVPDGSETTNATEWAVMFDGFIEGVEYADDVMSVSAMDKILPLQDTWIEPDRTKTPPWDREYGNEVVPIPIGSEIPVETDIAQIITDNVPATVGYVGGTPTLYTPISPGWAMNKTTTTSDNSVIGQIESWVTQIGWLCRYRWDDYRKAYRLTLWEPERTKTWTSGSPSFTSSQVLDFSTLEVRRDDIRNCGDAEYGNAVATDNELQWKRETVYREDTTSIAKYGRRYFRIGIGTNQEINDATSAGKLLDAVISDLKEPKADAEVTVTYRHYVEVGDLVRIEADGQRFSSDQAFAVVSVRHTLTATERRTTLGLRGGNPIGRRTRWWDVLLTPGRAAAAGLRPLDVPTTLTPVITAGGVRIRWQMPVNAGSRQYMDTEVHRSTSSTFTPSSSTLVAVVRGMSSAVFEQDPGVTRYYKVIHRDTLGTSSAASSAITAIAGRLTPAWLPTEWKTAATVRQASNQTWNVGSVSADQKLTLSTVEFNEGGIWDPGLSSFVAPASGLYVVTVSVGYTRTSGDALGLRLYIKGAGTDYRAGYEYAAGTLSASWVVMIDNGHELEVYLTAESGKAVNITTQAARTFVSVGILFAT